MIGHKTFDFSLLGAGLRPARIPKIAGHTVTPFCAGRIQQKRYAILSVSCRPFWFKERFFIAFLLGIIRKVIILIIKRYVILSFEGYFF